MRKGINPIFIFIGIIFLGFGIMVFSVIFPILNNIIDGVAPGLDPITAIFISAIPVILVILLLWAAKQRFMGASF